ncbi:heavy-metal-associated domain-containing protein [Pleomorphomonas sp. NRK KF1]|uniref:heavy-metal-associated domain-containing protein n=1 Tax=Pleomorphomonas sp. NRK KF1 TaxID=2943000 RepID=UPI0020434547|nr:heavy-metal-associated domain-containing protein [Pleomorphomonas sp. NRK KF1]MCM5553922.1 heavy-metal-associated domain-containing protein [Pleomorphomonas sp. NRK KF1]
MYQFTIPNMACGGCARSVTKALQGVDADAKIEADPTVHRVSVESPASEAALRAALTAAGYPAS